MTSIKGSKVLITGANRGLGKAYAEAFVAAGAAEVFGGARNPDSISVPGVTPVALDITDAADIAHAVEQCGDINILVNNAGLMHTSPAVAAVSESAAREEMEVNYFGTLAMSRAFAPILANHGGGTLVNMVSVAAWYANPFSASYSASKSAQWSLTNSLRTELRSQGTHVVGVYAGFIETDMAADHVGPKIAPSELARLTLEAIESNQAEVLADEKTKTMKASLPTDIESIYPAMQKMWESGRWA